MKPMHKSSNLTKPRDPEFDIRVWIKVDVLPREVPNNIGEEVAWEKINMAIQRHAFLMSESLKEYFGSLAADEVDDRVNTKELNNETTHS